MKVVSVQEVDITMTGTSQTASITAVGNLAQSVVVGTWKISAVSVDTIADQLEVDMWLSDASTITLQRNSSTDTITATCFVIEFDSSVTVQKGTFSMASHETVEDVSITSVNLSNAWSMVYARHTEDSGYTRDGRCSTRHLKHSLSSTTNLKIERGEGKSSVDGHWFVVEDSEATVSHENCNHQSALSVNHTLGASRSVVLADTFIFGSYKTPEPEWADEAAAYCELTSTTQITTYDGYSTSEIENFNVDVVEDTALTVQHKSVSMPGTSGGSGTQSITSVDLTVAIILPCTKSGGVASSINSSGTVDDRYVQLKFNSSTQVAWSRGGTNGGGDLAYQVIEFELATVTVDSEQEGYRFREDDGSESGASWLASQDTNVTRNKETATRLRTLIDYTGNPDTAQAKLQYKRTDEGSSEWRDV